MNKKLKIVITFIAVIVVAFILIRFYLNNGGKRDIHSEETAFSVSSKVIVNEFTSNAETSNKKYLDKPVAVSGTVTSVSGNEVILDDVVNCNFLTADSTIIKDKKVLVKGRVLGYDDLLGELKLDQCNLSINK